jgi:ribosomal protein S18 acetylase RimI-like enzyme
MGTSLRPARDEDNDFLQEVYASTREEELAPLGWTDAQKKEFIKFQFLAQKNDYQMHFPPEGHQIILCDGRQAGRIWIDRKEKVILLVDIALLPEFRNRGIGTALIRNLQAEAAAVGVSVNLHVFMEDRALQLYKRLGFEITGEAGVYYSMEWIPSSTLQDRS